ncbi:MAG: hydrogenase [Gammaproteobacteria bacterium]
MTSPLIERLLRQHGYPLLDAENYPQFVYAKDYAVLFFPNDPVQFPESNDVAVVLPELLKVWQQPLQAAVVGTDIERELQRQFRFNRWPALVFLQRGDYLGAITGIWDWQDFLAEGAKILNSPATEPPPFDFDTICTGGH